MNFIVVIFELLRMSFLGLQKGIFYKPNGKKLASFLESLGPIFTKFGQLLSTRTDILDFDRLIQMLEAVEIRGIQIPMDTNDSEMEDLSEECVNIKKLGTCNPESEVMDFNTEPYNNPGESGPDSGMCAKYNWAKGCNITWDGITNKDSPCNV